MTTACFDLFDDVTIPSRWHLGAASLADGTERRLRAGIRLEATETVRVPVTHPGRRLDFSLTSFAVPVVTPRLANAISAVVDERDLQCVPVCVDDKFSMVALNAVRVVRCLCETESEFIKWTAQDHRADLAGQYRQVTKLVLDREAIPTDARFFRVQGWTVALVISAAVKDAMESAGCLGARFTRLRTTTTAT